ncbi:unnamed protein product [Cyclocybe aegerita]|uniref:Uncharacterized protein n=1 Tax=Cyclocybe aegerita TaxID=1973307 RepID=A0A8S0WQ17_CYCAE|nr:unnamed protein product [Cyclocybe aegerita]
MDNRPNLHESLFSRNSTPPSSQQAQHPFSPQHISNNSSPSLIDSLFQGISPPAPDHQSTLDSHPSEIYDSASLAPGAPLPPDEPVNSQSASNSSTATERQNALLSLLSGGPPPAPRPQPVAQPPQNLPQQVPTPPGSSSQRSNASPQQTETQKILDQIMGGTTSRSTTYSDTQRSNPQAPSPPYTRDDFRSFQPHDHSAETSPRARPLQHPPQAPPPPQQQQQQQQPPSPRRSMFEFTSPFDHLSSSTGSIKKKAVPPQPSNVSSGNEDSSWTSVTDPKRQSMENLLENLTRGQPQQTQPQPPAYESYLSSDYSQGESAPIRAPLPPIPASKPVSVPIPIPNVTGSPRGGSPKGQPLHRPQPRAAEVNNSQQAPYPGSGGRRDKDSSPGPRGRGGAPRAGQPGLKFSKPRSPSPQSQTIIFDVSLPLEEILARDAVKSTAIALVRQDSVFLPGTTIGATHWVAYAMTRGRVRVISRSSGDRTLLQLPQIFSQASSVIDMAVYVNRLAGVTSDGGFVVWELPELITDDVPGRILLCVPPTNDSDAIRAVKWHPKDPDTLAIASDNQIYVIDLANTHALHGQPLPHSDLHHIGQPFNVPSTVVAFDFDVVHHALATISEDSSLTIWNMHDSLPYAVHKIRGEDIPSSLTFVDGGIVVGRRNGTIFQLLSMTNKSILSTIKFINSAQEDPDMFGHISYDSRIQTLWVANSRRESLIALKVHIEPSFATGEESVRGWI